MDQQDERKPRKVLRWLFLLVALVVGVLAVWLFVMPYRPGDGPPRFTISKRTTHIIKPLTERGRPDYFAWLNRLHGEGVNNDDNAFAVYVVVLPDDAFGPGHRRQTLDALGIDPPADGPRLAVMSKDIEEQLDETESVDWTDDRFAALSAHLDEQAAALDALIAGSDRPRFYRPLVRNPKSPMLLSTLVPSPTETIRAAKLLRVRAIRSAARGDFDSARRDVLAMARMGDHYASGPTLIERLIGYALRALAHDAYVSLSLRFEASVEQLRGLVADFEALPPVEPVWPVIDGSERVYVLDTIVCLSDDPAAFDEVRSTMDTPMGRVYHRFINWGVVLEDTNDTFDTFVAAMQTKDVPARHLAVAAAQDAVDALEGQIRGRGLTERWSNALRCILFISLNLAQTTTDRVAAGEILTGAALRLAEHRARHGAYPAALADIEAYRERGVPLDPYANRPLSYRRTDDGYLLYSIGDDFEDDGGVHDFEEGDIVVPQPREAKQ